MQRQSTIADVAQLAGVGKATASRVINGSSQVTDETRLKVLSAIEQLAFRPNRSARRLSKGDETRTIGVLESFITAPAFVDRLRGIQDVVEGQSDFDLMLFSCRTLDRYEPMLRRIADQRSVEALFVVDLKLSDEQAKLLARANIAVVSLSGVRGSIPYVGTDDRRGGYLATNHLLNLGHLRIGYVGDSFLDPFGFTTSRDRYDGYLDALAEAEVRPVESWVAFGKHEKATAVNLATHVLSQPDRPTALFAMADLQALGCLAAAQNLGLRVPEDVSVIGFDDIDVSAHVGLTTVRQHLAESGRVAARYLLSVVNGEPPHSTALPDVEVIVRRTTASRR